VEAPRNESLDAEAVELLRIVNLLRREDPSASALSSGNHDLVRRLGEAAHGPTLTAPESLLDEYMARWEASNLAVARELVGDDDALFRVPRKTDNTTTEQRLDPGRLDHFIELLELPEQTHRPLRELVEREATGC
jgi:hypothetical protein